MRKQSDIRFFPTVRLFNLACLLCQQPSDQPVCEFCKFDTQFLLHYGYCGNLLHYPLIRRQFRHTGFTELWACGPYAWPFDVLITKMKFNRCLLSAAILSQWFCNNLQQTRRALPDCLLPVPVHLPRLLSRRFNQAALLASHIGKELNIPIDYSWATRKLSRSQHTLDRAQRLLNLRQVYHVNVPQGCTRVAIIDDVVTTGSTVDILARALRAQHPDLVVEVWAMALTFSRPLAR